MISVTIGEKKGRRVSSWNKGSGNVPNHDDEKNKNQKDSSTHENIDALQVVTIQCDHESLKLKYSKKQMEKITKLTMFEDPSFFAKEAKGQSKNGDIPAHEKISEININNTLSFFKGKFVVTQVFQEDIRLETHNNIP